MPSCASSLCMAACTGERRDMSFHASVASCDSSMRRMSFISFASASLAGSARRDFGGHMGRRDFLGELRAGAALQQFRMTCFCSAPGIGARLLVARGNRLGLRARHHRIACQRRILDGAGDFHVDGRDDFDVGTHTAGGQDDRIGSEPFTHLRERGAHVLGDVSLNSHLCSPRLPTAVTIRTLRLSGSSFHASTCSPGTLTRKNRASAARSAGGVSNTAGSPPRS